MFLDLDNFKVVNDSLGHAIRRRTAGGRGTAHSSLPADQDTLARLSGDEFAVLVEDVTSPESLLRVTERIQDRFRAPFSVGQHELFASASIGVVTRTPSSRTGRHAPRG